MKQLSVLVLTFSLFSLLNTNAQWTKGEGNGYYKLSAWYLEADQHYTDTGNIDPNATRGQFNLNLYGEYDMGFSKKRKLWLPLTLLWDYRPVIHKEVAMEAIKQVMGNLTK